LPDDTVLIASVEAFLSTERILIESAPSHLEAERILITTELPA
jgi:hypothetical protein